MSTLGSKFVMYKDIHAGDEVIYHEEGCSGRVKIVSIGHDGTFRGVPGTRTVVTVRALEKIGWLANEGEEWEACVANDPRISSNSNWSISK
jgi:hypothetical protein